MVLAAPGRPVTVPVDPPASFRTRSTRQALPSGRAVAGGLLVAIAVLGVFAASRATGRRPTAAYLVAARAIAPGDVLAAADVERHTDELPDRVAARTFSDPDELVGRVALGPLDAGDVVPRGLVADRAAAPSEQLSFAVDADRALNARLRPGERVDVLVTYGSGESASTHVVVRRAHVVEVDAGGDGSLAGAAATVLTLSLDDPAQAIRLAHAVRAGELTVVRTTYETAQSDGPAVYRASDVASTDSEG
jgi:Flp pilus assembly protein CpaB